MKKYAWTLLLVAGLAGQAWAGVLDTDKIMDYLKAKSNEAYAGPQVSFKGEMGLGLALPIYTLHNGKKGAGRVEYAYPSIGYGRIEGGKDRLQTTCLFDLIAISNKLWKQWAAGHVDVTELPPVKFGPWIQWKDINRLSEPWIIGERTGVMAVYRFGG